MVCKSVACSNIPNKHVLSVDVRHKYAVHSLTESYFEKLLSIFDKIDPNLTPCLINQLV